MRGSNISAVYLLWL